MSDKSVAIKKPENQKTKITKVHDVIILDKSGSMCSIRDETVSMFNEQVDSILTKSKDIDTNVSLVTFSDTVDEPIFWEEPVDKISKLTKEDYVPNGLTAMLDAVGFVINKLKELDDADNEDVAFLVSIVSDGQENNSKEHSYESISNLIKNCESTKRWTFTYLGANQNLRDISAKMNISIHNMMNFCADPNGMKIASSASSKMRNVMYAAYSGGDAQSNMAFNFDTSTDNTKDD